MGWKVTKDVCMGDRRDGNKGTTVPQIFPRRAVHIIIIIILVCHTFSFAKSLKFCSAITYIYANKLKIYFCKMEIYFTVRSL